MKQCENIRSGSVATKIKSFRPSRWRLCQQLDGRAFALHSLPHTSKPKRFPTRRGRYTKPCAGVCVPYLYQVARGLLKAHRGKVRASAVTDFAVIEGVSIKFGATAATGIAGPVAIWNFANQPGATFGVSPTPC